MTIIHGAINEISGIDPNNTGFNKRIITLHSTDNQSMFIEFRGREPKIDALLKVRGLDGSTD